MRWCGGATMPAALVVFMVTAHLDPPPSELPAHESDIVASRYV